MTEDPLLGAARATGWSGNKVSVVTSPEVTGITGAGWEADVGGAG